MNQAMWGLVGFVSLHSTASTIYIFQDFFSRVKGRTKLTKLTKPLYTVGAGGREASEATRT